MSDELKIGDKVRVIDGSWSLEVKERLLVDTSGINLSGEFEVIALHPDLPTSGYPGRGRNNTIIVAGNRVVFISREFLRKEKLFCPTCGKRRDVLGG